MMMKTRTGTGSAGVVTRAALCGIGSGACPQVTAGSQKGEMARGRSRNRERSDPRSRSGRSREPSKGQEDVLTLPESHLDPMLHEAAVQYSIYSPDTNSLRAVSPVFVFSSFAEQVTQVHGASVAGQVNNQAQAALLRYKKPLSPSFLKTITELAEKGGCKSIRLKAARKKAAIAPL
nr:uncharacterized protein LOC107280587 isoform X2 [Oryza sativa Japonica Group]